MRRNKHHRFEMLAWIVAVAVSVLFAALGPDASGLHNFFTHDSIILNGPR
ncbi:hypothetical protein [Ramlibacter sp.]